MTPFKFVRSVAGIFIFLFITAPIVSNAGDSSPIKQQPIEVRDYKRDTYYRFPSGIYQQSDIQQLATGKVQNKALLALFEHSGWIKNGVVVSINELSKKRVHVTALAGLLNDDREVIGIARFGYGGPAQTLLVTWDLATEQLTRMVALPLKVEGLNTVTPDLRSIFSYDFRVEGKRTLALFDARTGELNRAVYKYPAVDLGLDMEADPAISPDGRYIAVLTAKKTSEGQITDDYWRVLRVSDGQEMASYSGSVACDGVKRMRSHFIFSPDSLRFHITWRCATKTTDDSFDYGKAYGWIGSTENWQASRVEKLDKMIGRGVFSADSKRLITHMKIYDLSSKSINEFTHCKDSNKRLGKLIPGTSLYLYLADDKYEFRTELNNKCHVITSGPINFNSDDSKSVLITSDYKQVVSLKDKYQSWIIDVFNVNFPDAGVLEKARKKEQKAAEIKAELDRVLAEAKKLYDAGFVEQALDILDEYAERPDTPPSQKITNSALTWAKKLPLERVGKTLLTMYRKRLSQPVKIGRGFYGDDDVNLSEGFLVEKVFPRSSADKAGLRKADIVLALNGDKVNSDDEFIQRLKSYKIGDAVELTVLRNDVSRKISITLDEALANSGAVWGLFHILEYGMVAAAAGHPDLTMDAANEAQRIADKYKSSINTEMIKSFITALKALSMASKGNVTKAYVYALKEGGFVTGGFDLLQTHYISGNTNSEFWMPLYKDRNKLAYLLKVDESKLSKTPTYNFGNQPYPNLNGQIMNKQDKKKSTPKKPGATILDD